jgi:energy-converting hydrogenase Eha subunit G
VVVKALFWSSLAPEVVLALVSWVVPELTALRPFDLLDGAVLGLAMVTSGSLFWLEVRANRQDDDEWSAIAWLYATAFGLSLFLSLYMLPALYFAP